MRFNWTFDAHKQSLSAPSGWTITVREIATWLQDRVHHRHDLTGPWKGWRIRGKWLISPKGQRWAPVELLLASPDESDSPPQQRNARPLRRERHSPNHSKTASSEGRSHTASTPTTANEVERTQRTARVIDLAAYRKQAR